MQKKIQQNNGQERQRQKALGAYLSAYQAAKKYVVGMIEKFNSEGCPDPTNGAYGASLALERLPASFFAVNIFYRLGNNYEGHAVARLVLEQIAWAYAAYEHDDLAVASKIGATQAISKLKTLDGRVGRMYGFLSKKLILTTQAILNLSLSRMRKLRFCMPNRDSIRAMNSDGYSDIYGQEGEEPIPGISF